MLITQKGIDLLKHLEGFRDRMYLDSAGLPTIGFGTLIDTKEEAYLMTATITEEVGEALLKKDVMKTEARLIPLLKQSPNSNQMDAIILFAYNVGTTALRTSTLLKKFNIDPDDISIRDEFMKWVFADHKRIPGLFNRRQQEADLYYS